jgi:magnesium chelatase family protein
MIEMVQQRLNLSARAYHRVLRVARTIADLSQSEIFKVLTLQKHSYRGNHFKINSGL